VSVIALKFHSTIEVPLVWAQSLERALNATLAFSDVKLVWLDEYGVSLTATDVNEAKGIDPSIADRRRADALVQAQRISNTTQAWTRIEIDRG
jgi:hypothetical protein